MWKCEDESGFHSQQFPHLSHHPHFHVYKHENPHHRRRRLHRLPRRALVRHEVPRAPDSQPRRADLRRQPGEPARRGKRGQLPLHQGRHFRPVVHRPAVCQRGARLGDSPRGRVARRPQHHRPHGVCENQRHGHREFAERGPPPVAARRLRGPRVLPREHRRSVRLAGF